MLLSPTLRVWSAGLFVCITGGLFGFDTGSGAITVMPQFREHFGVLQPFMRGLVVSIILIPSAVSGFLAGPISDRISRKRTISVGCAIFALGFAISSGAPNLAVLIVARCISGVGEGLFLSATVCYLTEISTSNLRGKLITCFQLFTTGGIALGFFTCYGTVKIQSSFAWRGPWIGVTIVALGTAFGSWSLPYSPRWLCSKGRKEEAEAVFDLITGHEHAIERADLLAVPATDPSHRWTAMFSKGVRGRTFLGAFLNVFQQLTGIDAVLFFSPLLFAQAGLDPKTSSFIASGVTGLVLFGVTALGTYYVDKVGRRTLLLWGGIAIASCMLTMGSIYASGANHTAGGRWSVIALIELYAVSFAGSWALCVRLYASEIQPPATRAAASSFGQGANQAVNFLVALSAPVFLAKVPSGIYFLYGSLTAFATVICFFFVSETLGKSLEMIDTTFDDHSVAVSWPRMLRPSPGDRLRNRRPSRRRSSVHLDAEGRPTFPVRMGMERLGSSALMGSAIEE